MDWTLLCTIVVFVRCLQGYWLSVLLINWTNNRTICAETVLEVRKKVSSVDPKGSTSSPLIVLPLAFFIVTAANVLSTVGSLIPFSRREAFFGAILGKKTTGFGKRHLTRKARF
jgi:hypothetical protein